MTPNMANNTQKHGYMKKERLVLELDIIKYIYGHMTLIITSNVHFNNEIAIDVAKTSPMTSLQVL